MPVTDWAGEGVAKFGRCSVVGDLAAAAQCSDEKNRLSTSRPAIHDSVHSVLLSLDRRRD